MCGRSLTWPTPFFYQLQKQKLSQETRKANFPMSPFAALFQLVATRNWAQAVRKPRGAKLIVKQDAQ